MWRCIKPWEPGVYEWMGVRFREESRYQHPYEEYLYSKLNSRCKSDKSMQQMEDMINKLQSRKSWFRWSLFNNAASKRLPTWKFQLVNSKNQLVGKIGGCWTPSSIEGADHCRWHNAKNTNYPRYISEAHSLHTWNKIHKFQSTKR
jgi:hypothetical protein